MPLEGFGKSEISKNQRFEVVLFSCAHKSIVSSIAEYLRETNDDIFIPPHLQISVSNYVRRKEDQNLPEEGREQIAINRTMGVKNLLKYFPFTIEQIKKFCIIFDDESAMWDPQHKLNLVLAKKNWI